MIHNKLDLLKRTNKGKFLVKEYEEMFLSAGFDDLEYIDLTKSDTLLRSVKEIFPVIQNQFEILHDNITFFDSKLLMKAFSNSEYCYVYSDDVYYCGMYLTNSISAQQYCLNIAKLGYSNTCFILDKELKFSIRINFYKEDHNEYQNQFDIQLKQQ